MPITPSRASSAGVFFVFALCCFRFVVFSGAARLGGFDRTDFLTVADLFAADLVVAMLITPVSGVVRHGRKTAEAEKRKISSLLRNFPTPWDKFSMASN